MNSSPSRKTKGKYATSECNFSGVYKHNDRILYSQNILENAGIPRTKFTIDVFNAILHQVDVARNSVEAEICARFLRKQVPCSRWTMNRILTHLYKEKILLMVHAGNRIKGIERTFVLHPDILRWGQFRSEISKKKAQGENGNPGAESNNDFLPEGSKLNPFPEVTTSVEAPAEEREGAHALNAEMPKDDELKAPVGAVDSAIQSTENESLILDCGEHHEVEAEPKAQAHQEAPGSPRHRPEVPRATPAPRHRQEYSREEKFRRESRSREAKDRFYRRRCQDKPQASALLRHPAAKVEVKPRASEALYRLGEILAGLSVPLVAAGEVARRFSGKAEESILDLCTGLERLAADGAEFDPLAFCRSVVEEYPRFLRWRQAMGDAWAAGWLRLKVLRGRLEACGVRCVDWALDQLAGWTLMEFSNLEEILARFPAWTEGQTTLRNPGGFLAKLCSSPERFREWLPRLEVVLKPGLDPREVRKAEARALKQAECEKAQEAFEQSERERLKDPLERYAMQDGQRLTHENRAYYEAEHRRLMEKIQSWDAEKALCYNPVG